MIGILPRWCWSNSRLKKMIHEMCQAIETVYMLRPQVMKSEGIRREFDCVMEVGCWRRSSLGAPHPSLFLFVIDSYILLFGLLTMQIIVAAHNLQKGHQNERSHLWTKHIWRNLPLPGSLPLTDRTSTSKHVAVALWRQRQHWRWSESFCETWPDNQHVKPSIS